MNNVLIILFAANGFDKGAQGLAGEAGRVADAVLVADQAELLEDQPETYLAALAQACGGPGTRAVLLANDTYSQELAPRLAHRLGGSAADDCVEVRVEGGVVRAGRQVYGGKAHAVLALKRSPAVVWLRARSFAPAAPREAAGEVTRAALNVQADARTRVVERRREAGGESRLEEARVIVSGGRGVGGPEPFETELRPLAELLGAQLAASRAACDAGWVPPTWQVGQTGKKVTPELYLAIAITGASQHMAGISEARTIAAINTDPDAPIFKHCRFGIVEDYRKVVPLLREKLRELLAVS